MSRAKNPFVVTGRIEPDYFCDRVIESARLVKSVTNGNNVVIISPRRMGKTGLIQFCYDKAEIAESYYTFFFDALHTSSLREFTYTLGKTIFETLLPRSTKMTTLFTQTLRSLSGKFGFNPVTSLPEFSVELGDIEQPEYTLEEIFKLLATADKPCIVAIDEFQQISKYPEKNIEALLRGHIQKIENSNFIFAGSERTMMQSMFLSSARPFYRSADVMELGAIPKELYIEFVEYHFNKSGRTVADGVVEWVYELFEGYTFYLQKCFNEAYANTLIGEECTMEIAKVAIEDMVGLYDTIFREILSNIPEKQKELLYAIAKEGKAEQILSSTFIKRYSLTTTSSIQAATKKLLSRELITEQNKIYSLTDKLFEMWINRVNNI
ncbi:MAG: ATP-binding protein [Rikenellaceae bacterium]